MQRKTAPACCLPKQLCSVCLFIGPYLLKEHLGGKSIRRKFDYGTSLADEEVAVALRLNLCLRLCFGPYCFKTIKDSAALTLLPIRWHSSTLAGEPKV